MLPLFWDGWIPVDTFSRTKNGAEPSPFILQRGNSTATEYGTPVQFAGTRGGAAIKSVTFVLAVLNSSGDSFVEVCPAGTDAQRMKSSKPGLEDKGETHILSAVIFQADPSVGQDKDNRSGVHRAPVFPSKRGQIQFGRAESRLGQDVCALVSIPWRDSSVPATFL